MGKGLTFFILLRDARDDSHGLVGNKDGSSLYEWKMLLLFCF